ncbi:MAG: helix-turn-helix domain-containing protein, partial [Pseudonocardia sp.]
GAVATLRAAAPLPDPALGLVAAQLGAGAAVEAVADRLGWTTRSLHRRSRAAFGYGPAALRRILRFRRAVMLAFDGVAPVEVALRTGYADQSHLYREVRILAGVPLGQLLRGAKRSTPLPSGSCTTA